MSAFVFVTLIASLIFFGFITFLIWAVKTDQFEDLSMPAERILWEDEQDD